MKIIGLCGGSGSGKSIICKIFDEFGIHSINADLVYHDLISSDSECSRELILVFGEEIKTPRNGVDREKLGKIVFSSKEKLNTLNEITHKHILAQTKKIISSIEQSSDANAIIFDAPLLFESGFNKECDVTICVIADEDTRVNRIIKRDSISEDKARARIKAQITNEELIKRCDYVIVNDSSFDVLKERVEKVKKQIIDNE